MRALLRRIQKAIERRLHPCNECIYRRRFDEEAARYAAEKAEIEQAFKVQYDE